MIRFYIADMAFGDAVVEWGDICSDRRMPISLVFTAHESQADVVIMRESANAKGGSTHRNYSKTNPREIVWAKISIAISEKGDSLARVCLQEVGHALMGDFHSPNDDDIMSSPIKANSITSTDENTFVRIYEERNNAIT